MKKALVTGGSRGIGEAICRRLAENGYKVFVNYVYSKEKAEKIAIEIGGEAVCFDVSDNEAVKAFFYGTGFIDLLVNNAGVSEIDLFTSISAEKAERILNINLKGAMNCARAALPEMINEKKGNIINISSMWGQCGASCEVDYSASKAGLDKVTKDLCKLVKDEDVRIFLTDPGWCRTDLGGPMAPNDPISAVPGLLAGGFASDAKNGSYLHAQDYAHLTLEEIVKGVEEGKYPL